MTVLRNGQLVGEWPTTELTAGRARLEDARDGSYTTLEALETKAAGLAGRARGDAAGSRGQGDREERARSRPSTSRSIAARSSVSPACSARGAPRSHACSSAPTARTRGSSTSTGKPVSIRSPRAATANGVAFCPENRRTEGLVEELTVRENIILALQAARGWTRPIPRKRQDELVDHWIGALDIRTVGRRAARETLSGGNQQKVLLARWLITQPKLLILDEPTRGIDVGAKTEIQRLVVSLCDDGMSVLFISAEIEEVLRLSHKVAVLRDRHLVAEFANDEHVTIDSLVHTIAGGAAA